MVVVKNQGNGVSGPFTTKVEFFKGGTYGGSPVVIAVPPPAILAFPALAAGGSQELVLPPVFSSFACGNLDSPLHATICLRPHRCLATSESLSMTAS